VALFVGVPRKSKIIYRVCSGNPAGTEEKENITDIELEELLKYIP
jgi:hypothetical protein